MEDGWRCRPGDLIFLSVLQGSVGDPGPPGYSGMKVECTLLNISGVLLTGSYKVTRETFWM